MPEQKVYLFPGIGSTANMYVKLSSIQNKIYLCDWPNYKGAKSIGDLADRCIENYKFDRNTIIGGSSLGGMVASEIAKKVNAKGLILIGSCLNFKVMTIRKLTNIGERLISDSFFQHISTFLPKSFTAKTTLLTDPGFVRWALRALYDWSGISREDLNFVASIHGKLDVTLPASKVQYDELVLTGGHFLAITHYRAVSRFIDQQLKKCN